MARIEIDLNPVIFMTTDAIGKPGDRVFYVQGRNDEQTVTLVIEKMQLQSLSVGTEQFLAEISQRFPDLPEASGEFDEMEMHITPPVDPLFRVGELGLGYDVDQDLVVLLAREILVEGQEVEDSGVVRFWVSRSQLRAMVRWGLEVISHGRPLCPQCGEPMEAGTHFCPKKNGHRS